MRKILLQHSKLVQLWRTSAPKVTVRYLSLTKGGKLKTMIGPAILVMTPMLVISTYFSKISAQSNDMLDSSDKKVDVEQAAKKKAGRKSRLGRSHFDKFASVEFQSQFFMTPRDFLDCIVLDLPKPRIKRKLLNENQYQAMMEQVPKLRDSVEENPTLFRDLNENGLISYVEYLFLLSLLTRPQSGFRIAFDLIDTSAEGTIVREEFANFCQMGLTSKTLVIDMHLPTTTLTAHFFGVKGDKPLKFSQFSAFLLNFQREMLLAEFVEYSRGQETIDSIDFAEILLKYTNLKPKAKQEFLGRVSNLEDVITFKEFELFTKLLNNLEDFAIAVRMYSIAGKSLSQNEFKRAAKICLNGENLPDRLVNMVFHLFDQQGDGLLGYDEFIVVMQNRLRRRLMASLYPKSSWVKFKRCVNKVMKESQHVYH